METSYKMTQTAENNEHYTCSSDNNDHHQNHANVSPVYRHSDCDIDNSNDNYRATAVTNMLEPHKNGEVQQHNTFVDYKINYNVSPSFNKAKHSPHFDDSCYKSPEIMISMDVKTGEINFDVISVNELEDFNKEKHDILLASTFDESVTYRYKDIFHRGIVDISKRVRGKLSPSSCQGDEHWKSGTDRKPDDVLDKPRLSNTAGRSPGGGDYCVQNVRLQTHLQPPIPHTESKYETFSPDKKVRFENDMGNTQNRPDGHCGIGQGKYDRSWSNNHGYTRDWSGQNYDRGYDYRYHRGFCKKEVTKPDESDNHDINKQRRVISFSENDLIYSAKNEKQVNNNYKIGKYGNQKMKQVTILPRGCTLDSVTDDRGVAKDEGEPKHTLTSDDKQSDGESVPYGKYSRNITSDRKYYKKKYAVNGDMAEDADGSGDADEEQKWKKNRNNRYRKGGKPRTRKPRKKVPKTMMEQFQNQLRGGQMRSVFSRWKTDTLKTIKLVDEMHNGTFAIKYKALYKSEMVVLSVYIDQDTSDINAIDMVHLRNSKFVSGIRDCITGPYSSLWLLSKYYPNSDLQKLLFRDPERHVIGEVHAQFITSGLMFALDYLHRNDIVHGNIKPSKIMISRNGFPVLSGYLIVDDTVLEERRDVYTPAYAAPERFRGNRGMAIDIFSVGCVAYEIVTGRTPFDDGNMEALRANILNHSYRPVFQPERFSYAGELFIGSCLKKSLKYRFTIGPNREHFLFEEWFSSLDLIEIERQNAFSPILQAMKQIDNAVSLPWDKKTVNFNWGRALDITCPELEPIGFHFDWRFTQNFLLDFFAF